MAQVWETRLSNKHVGTQVNDARVKYLNDCKPEGKVGNETFAITVKQRRNGLAFGDALRGEQRK